MLRSRESVFQPVHREEPHSLGGYATSGVRTSSHRDHVLSSLFRPQGFMADGASNRMCSGIEVSGP